MTAAIDLRRLGHLAPLPADLLCAAAPGYLMGRQQATAASGWLAAALAYATKELRGATAALVPVAGPRMGEAAGYVVADYLLQHGQTTRQAVPPPGSLWDSAAAQAIDSADRVRLAREASSRSLDRHAVDLVTPAAQAGNLEAMHLLAGWLWFAGHRTEMRRWVDRALHAGNPGTLVWLASILGEIDQLQEREELLWELAAKGHPIGLWGLIRLLDGTGRSQAAEKLLGGMAEAGDPDAIWEMADRLEQRGQGHKTEGWLRRLAEDGDVLATLELARLLEGTARAEEAEGWLRRAAERGDDEAMLELGGLLERDGRAQEAEGWLRQAAEAGTIRATRELVGLMERDGRGQEAERWLRHATELGLTLGNDLAGLLERTGRAQEAAHLRRFGIEPGGRTADAW